MMGGLRYKTLVTASRVFVGSISHAIGIIKEKIRESVLRFAETIRVIRGANERAIARLNSSGLIQLIEAGEVTEISVSVAGKELSLKRKDIEALKAYLEKQSEYLADFDLLEKAAAAGIDIERVITDMVG